MYVYIQPPSHPFRSLPLPSFLPSFDPSTFRPFRASAYVTFISFSSFFFLSPSKRIRFRIFEYRAVSLYSSVVIIRLISTLRRRECFESSFLDSFKYLNRSSKTSTSGKKEQLLKLSLLTKKHRYNN